MDGETIRSFIKGYPNEKVDQESKIVRRDTDDLRRAQSDDVQMDGLDELQYNRWWQRGEEVLRRSR